MKIAIRKYSLIFLIISLMVCCFAPMCVCADTSELHCYPTEEQIEKYKEDGTWEKRQEYVKTLNYAAASQELIKNAVKRNNSSVPNTAGDNLPDGRKEMQVTGDASILLVRVEFADITFENSQAYSEEEFFNMVMGDENTGIFPYESLNAYYKRSSYNKLNITTDRAYSCTLSKARDAYEWTDTGEQALIKEVFELLDDTVDFADYDANNDGIVDGICINFAGENTGWGSTWWSHKYRFNDNSIKFDGVTPASYVFMETYPAGDSYGTQTLIHETGHMLGLPDYYSQTGDGIGATDMMNNNSGDHNGFSKWLLGWIEEDNILKINRSSGITEVELSPLAVESPGDDKLIAVIAPEDTSIFSEYFVVQYDEYIGNQSIWELQNPSYRVYHVNAELDEMKNNFFYDNMYAFDAHLIKAVSIVDEEYGSKQYCYREGDSLTPDTNESSAFYGGDIFGYTGISLTDFKTGESPSFSVAFKEKEVIDGSLEFEVTGEPLLNMAELTLKSNKPVINAWSLQEAYLEDGEGNKHPVELSYEDGSRKIKVSYLYIGNSLKPETEYTLVIPAGMFQIDEDVYSEECRINVKTGVFPGMEAADYTYEPSNLTNVFSLGTEKAGFICIKDRSGKNWTAELHLFKGTKAAGVKKFNIPVPGKYTEVMTLKGIPCYDGAIALEVRSGDPTDYSSMSSYYKIDQNGKILAGPYSIAKELNVFPAGNGIKGTVKISGALGAPALEDEYKLEIYTIDFKNKPASRLINMQKYLSDVYAMDEDSYVVIQESEFENIAGIYSNKDKLIKTISLKSKSDGSPCAAVKSGDNLAVMYCSYMEDNKTTVSVSLFDMKGNHLKTCDITTFNEWKSGDGWKMEKTRWGYSLYNTTSEQSDTICFINEDLELISSMQVPNSLSSGTHIGYRYIVKWYDITIWRYRAAITEPIAAVDTGDTPERDEPEGDNAAAVPDNSGDDSAPGTGDESGFLLMFFAMIVSGGVIVSCLRRIK